MVQPQWNRCYIEHYLNIIKLYEFVIPVTEHSEGTGSKSPLKVARTEN